MARRSSELREGLLNTAARATSSSAERYLSRGVMSRVDCRKRPGSVQGSVNVSAIEAPMGKPKLRADHISENLMGPHQAAEYSLGEASGVTVWKGLSTISAVLELCDKLSKTPEGTQIAGQLLRSESSWAPTCAEARAAESLSDFIRVLRIVLKELNESWVWLEMIQKQAHVSEDLPVSVLNECVALSKIIAVSRRPAAENAGRIRKGSHTNRRTG